MTSISFSVQGSAEAPYTVVFSTTAEGTLTATCSCPAGIVGQYSKHRFHILEGDSSAIVSGNAEMLDVVRSWFIGSDVEEALQELSARESDLELVKKQVSAANKKVARAMAT